MQSFKVVTPPERVYRLARSLDPCKLPAWKHLLAAERGRYDDYRNVFRVLYTSTSAAGAITEVLADLRPRYDRIAEIAMIEDDDVEPYDAETYMGAIAWRAMRARLDSRYLSEIAIVDRYASFVDLGAGASRSRIELRLGVAHLKMGDFTGRHRRISRSAARMIFNDQHAGLIAPSAEQPRDHTVAIFESGYQTDKLRARLEVVSIVRPGSNHPAVQTAIGLLLGRTKFSPLILPEDVRSLSA
jgi:hypothetical protein